VRLLLKALRRGEAVGILPDQVPEAGRRLDGFLRAPAYTMTLVGKLAEATGASVIMTARSGCLTAQATQFIHGICRKYKWRRRHACPQCGYRALVKLEPSQYL